MVSEPSLEVSLRRSLNRTTVRLFWMLLGGVAVLDSLLFLASTSRVNHRIEAEPMTETHPLCDHRSLASARSEVTTRRRAQGGARRQVGHSR